MMWSWQGWNWWGWLAMTAAMIAFWGVVIWAVAAIFRSADWPRRSDRPKLPERRDPEQLLAERFAAGEIDEEEYQRRLQVLRATRHDVWETNLRG